MGPEDIVVEEVVRYFSTPKFKRLSTRTEYPVQMGVYKGRADVVLIDEDGKIAAIIECKKIGYEGSGPNQLKGYLSATDTPLGVFANETTPAKWEFYENLGRNQFKSIDRSQFEAQVLKKGIIKILYNFVRRIFRPQTNRLPSVTPPSPEPIIDPPVVSPNPPYIIYTGGNQPLQNDNNTDFDPSLNGKPYYSEQNGFYWAANHHGIAECVPQHVKHIISNEELEIKSSREQLQTEINRLVDEKNGLEEQKQEYEQKIEQRVQERDRKKEELVGLEVQLQAPTETELNSPISDLDAAKQQPEEEISQLREEKDRLEREIGQKNQERARKEEELAGLEVQLQAPTKVELNPPSAEGSSDDTKQSKVSSIFQSIFPTFTTVVLLGLICYLFFFYTSAGDKAFSSGTGSSVQQQLNEIVNHAALFQAWEGGNWWVLTFPSIFLMLAIGTHVCFTHRKWGDWIVLLAATFVLDGIIAIKISQRIHDDKELRELITENWTIWDLNILAVLLLGFAISLLLGFGLSWTLELWKEVRALRNQSKEQEIRQGQINNQKIQREARITILKTEMENLQGEIGQLNEKVKDTQQKIDELLRQQLNDQIEASRTPIKTQIAILKAQMENLQSEIGQLNEKVKDTQQKIDQGQTKIDELSAHRNKWFVNGNKMESQVNQFLNGWCRFVAHSADGTTDVSAQIDRIKQSAYETLNQHFRDSRDYSS